MSLPAPVPQDISVVVQGPIYGPAHQDLTQQVLQSVRRHLPGSEIILSTWAGSNVANLEYDRLVLSADPGGYPQPHDPRFSYNVNRQIVSTAAGLQAAQRKFAFKLRSDMLLNGAGFLKYFHRFPCRSSDYLVFEERIICLIGVNPSRGSSLFMPGDWLSFGLTSDLLRLWAVPLAPEPATSCYFQLHPEENRTGELEVSRFNPEQYIWVQSLSARFPLNFRHNQDITEEVIRIAEKSLVNNFILLEASQVPLVTPRHRFSRGTWASCYSHAEWVQLYRLHCDPSAAVPFDLTPLIKSLVLRALTLRQRFLGKPSGVRPPARTLVR